MNESSHNKINWDHEFKIMAKLKYRIFVSLISIFCIIIVFITMKNSVKKSCSLRCYDTLNGCREFASKSNSTCISSCPFNEEECSNLCKDSHKARLNKCTNNLNRCEKYCSDNTYSFIP
jgi:hypothetical protein